MNGTHLAFVTPENRPRDKQMPDIAAVASTATAATAATAATGPTTDAAAIIDSQQAPFATALIEQLVRQAVAGTGTAVTLPTDLQAADPQKDSASPAALAALMPLLMGMAMPVNPAVNAGPGDNQAAGAKSTAPVAQDASPALAALLAAGAGTGTASATPAAASITNGAAKDLPPAATAAESSAILAAPAKAQTADIGSSTDASQAKDSTQTFQAGFDATLAAADPTAAAAAARHAATPVAASAAPEVRVDTPVGSRN
ncbi:MAG TPA: hypothetical protein VMB75_08420, partial [Rhodocyclaceae bacterium]|nr:hypothetical protein [Rhodocyclaceae bacterium]